jgi:ankyrin repeat protein
MCHDQRGQRIMSDNIFSQIADGRTDLVFDYVSAGHAATSTDERGVSLIQWCAYSHDAVLEVLLAHGADPNCATKPSVATDQFMRDCRTKGETPLHRAAAFGTELTIQMLLDAGARVDAKDMYGDSALGWASWYLRPRSILRKLCYGEFRA